MNELLSQLTSEVRGSLRYRWYGMAVAWVVCLLGWTVVAWLPDVYEASARVYVDTSSDLKPLLRDQVIASDIQSELAYVSQSLLSAERLDRIARTLGLDATAVTERERQRVITQLAKDIEITTESNYVQSNTYLISYRNPDRDKAIAVVRALHDGLVEDTLDASRAGTNSAGSFIEDRIQAARLLLERKEAEIAQFKRTNASLLPGASGDYFTRLTGERDNLAAERLELQQLQAKRDRYRQQLSGQAPLLDESSRAGLQASPNSTEARIAAKQAEIDELLLTFTEASHEVGNRRDQLVMLEAQLERERAARAATGVDNFAAAATNPVYAAAQIALTEVEAEISTLETSIAQRETKVSELLDAIDEIPLIEAEFTALVRDMDVLEDNYDDLLRTRETQALTNEVELNEQTEFLTVNPPDASFSPVAPKRPLLLAGVFVFALAAGGGLCFLMTKVFPVVGSARALQKLLELPVLGTVTQAWEARHRQQRRRAVLAFGGALLFLFISFVSIAAIELLSDAGIHALFDGRLA